MRGTYEGQGARASGTHEGHEKKIKEHTSAYCWTNDSWRLWRGKQGTFLQLSTQGIAQKQKKKSRKLTHRARRVELSDWAFLKQNFNLQILWKLEAAILIHKSLSRGLPCSQRGTRGVGALVQPRASKKKKKATLFHFLRLACAKWWQAKLAGVNEEELFRAVK
jgi:hypothetical protein